MPPAPIVKKKAEKPKAYPQRVVTEFTAEKPLTAEVAKEILGWRVAKENEDYQLVDYLGDRVILDNNSRNRPFYRQLAETWKSEILHKNWQFNGETFKIDEYGNLHDGQHRLVGLVLAEQERLSESDGPHWKKTWSGPVWIEGLAVFGISSDDRVVNTIDTGKPRTLSDVIFRSGHFAKYKPAERKELAAITDFAVRLLWDRTGARSNAYAPVRSHSESMDFITNHMGLLRSVKHVFEEDEGSRVSRIVKAGTMAGLLYLMAVSTTDPKGYKGKESKLDFELRDKAEEYVTLLAGASPEVEAVMEAIAALADPDDGIPANQAERTATVVLGWQAFAKKGKIKEADLELHYSDGETPQLDEFPVVGGIDKGPYKKPDEDDKEAEGQTLAEEKADESTPAPAPAKKGQPKAKPENIHDVLSRLRKAVPKGTVLLFPEGKTGLCAWGNDATTVNMFTKGLVLDNAHPFGIKYVSVPEGAVDQVKADLTASGKKYTLVVTKDGKPEVGEVV